MTVRKVKINNKTKAKKSLVKKKVRSRTRNTSTEVKCILSGKVEQLSVAKLNKQANKLKFETSEEYVKYYICKECIKELKQGYTEKQIQKKNNIQDGISVPFNILRHYVKKFKNRQKIEKMEKRKEALKYMEEKAGAYIVTPKPRQTIDFTSEAQVAELTKSACLRPDIYLNNDRACNGCHIYELCKCAIRRWSDPDEKRGKRRK